MTIIKIPLGEISFDDESFRISEDLLPPPLLDSIREVGQLGPVILLDSGPAKTVVCGFRRLHALRRLGRPEAMARLLSSREHDWLGCFRMALWDNLSHRQLSPLEKTRVLLKLRTGGNVPDRVLIRDYMPALGLAPNEKALSAQLSLENLNPDLKRCLSDGRLTQAVAERIAAMSAPVQAELAGLMFKARFSASMQKKTLDLLEELRPVTGKSLDAPLKTPEIQAILSDAGASDFQKGERVYDFLYRLRNPRLAGAEELFLARKKRLALPGSIKIRPHPYFEEPGLCVEFEARDIERFRDLTSALYGAAQSSDMARLFDLD